ncbi:MAG: DNA repair protein RecO [Clostridiales Family XIII bacterium]|jgi:DNA repair protein RecO (recombination protein O)|nr:DNA repair protein RecO [Clostridiales Family XIII bacterium]
MHTVTDGIVFSQIKTLNGRRMIRLFSRDYGKISAGTSIRESGKSKSALALKPFVHGRYELNKTHSTYHINKAETLHSHYGLAGDMERYVNCSYVLELTDRLLPEGAPAEKLFLMLAEFLDLMEKRRKMFDPLVLSYIFKALKLWGAAPELEKCVACGNPAGSPAYFDIAGGGVICAECRASAAEGSNIEKFENDKLLYPINFGIVNVVKYLTDQPLRDFERLALDEGVSAALRLIARGYAAYHLDIGRLRTEEFFGVRDG